MSMQETIVENPYCTALDPISRQKYQHWVHKHVGHDPQLMQMNTFSTDPKDLLKIEAVHITNCSFKHLTSPKSR